MLIRRMAASFGKLQNHTLELSEGLNIIQAPNETGKSTWCAFLSSMLYGINSRERDKAGYIADKNRYAPWSGTAMAGRIDCLHGEDELTIMRATRRQTSPMGEFRAIYAGTGDIVPNLTGANCGEKQFCGTAVRYGTRYIEKRLRSRIAPEILKLTDELLQ